MRTNLTVTNLLHGVDLVLGMAWLKDGGPIDTLEYWTAVHSRLHLIFSENYGSMAGQAGQGWDSQSTFNE